MHSTLLSTPLQGGSNTYVVPDPVGPEEGTWGEEELLDLLMDAGRGWGKRSPALRPPYWVDQATKSAWRKAEQAYWAEWGSHLLSLGLRLLNEIQRRGRDLPTEEELSWAFHRYVRQEADAWTSLRKPKTTDARARTSARRVIEDWNPLWSAQQAKKSAAGGRAKKKFTPEMLDGLEHLTRSEQMEALGCSLSTIKALRASQRESLYDREHDKHEERTDSPGTDGVAQWRDARVARVERALERTPEGSLASDGERGEGSGEVHPVLDFLAGLGGEAHAGQRVGCWSSRTGLRGPLRLSEPYLSGGCLHGYPHGAREVP